MTINRTKNKTIILNQEDVHNDLHPNMWEYFLEILGIQKEATEIALEYISLDCINIEESQGCYNFNTIVLEKEDVNNPLHPNLWESWMETLGVAKETDSICLRLSSLDDNKKVD